MNKRCVVTGLGAITPLGSTVEQFWNNLAAGVSGIDYITRFDTSNQKVKIAGEVKDFDPTQYVERKELKRSDLFSIYAVSAATQAFYDSGLDKAEIDASRFGTIVGSGIGGLTSIEQNIEKMVDKGPAKVSPFYIPMAITNMAAGNVALRFGAKGLCSCVVTACASGNNCIGEAFRNIKHGYLDVCIAGGTEASITPSGVAGFSNLTALSTEEDPKKACRPFDKNRNGFVMGEGAGILILEELEHAKARGAHIYAEIVGYGTTCDAYHITAPTPDGEGAANAMKLAMQEAGITPEDVSYINAHGTSTHQNDSAETLAIHRAMGEAASSIPVSSTKSMTGHLLGATGAVEAIACVEAICHSLIPPTINYEEPDEECDLDYVPNQARACELRYVLSNSLGFGGHNAVLCLKKWEEA